MYKVGMVEVELTSFGGFHRVSFRQQKSIDNRFYYPCIDKEAEGNALGDFSVFLFEDFRLFIHRL